MLAPDRPDPEALLAALVLDPATFSRNRFFELFRDPAFRRVRRRASIVRSVVALVVRRAGGELALDELSGGVVLLRYEVEALCLRRTVRLEPLDAALVRYLLARAAKAPPQERDRQRVEAALGRLLVTEPARGASAQE